VTNFTTIKIIQQKRRTFYVISLTLFFTSLFALLWAGIFLFTFWLSIIFSSIGIFICVVTFRFINQCYNSYITSTRKTYISSMFPIKEKPTKQQIQFILSDLEYIFGNYFDEEADKQSLSKQESPLIRLLTKIKTNNLTARDVEKLNLLYSNNFVELSEMKRK
jgi:hypothetical protein